MMMTDLPTTPTPSAEEITDVLFNQLLKVMGLKRSNWLSWLLFFILSAPIRKMSTIVVELDRNIANKGFHTAVTQFMGYFIANTQIHGAEAIPQTGPLMVVCNHPAATDILLLIASIRRDDLKVLASDISIIQKLPNIAEHSIPVPYHIPSRLQTVRRVIQHLNSGGAILLFPRGDVEPDPTVSPGAEESLAGWSPSIELFLRRVPQTITVVAIASGVLSKKWFNNPLFRLWKKYEQRQKVAEIFQITSQLLTGKMPKSTPMINFSVPLTMDDLGGKNSPEGTLFVNLIEQARYLLAQHPHV